VTDWVTVVAACITLVSLAAAFGLYFAQRADSKKRDIDAALGMLEAVRNGMPRWSDEYFANTFDATNPDQLVRLRQHAEEDRKAVLAGAYRQVFLVPTAPLVALLEQPSAGDLISKETIEAANVALWQLGIFNQLAQQQTDFNTSHAAAIASGTPAEREPLAAASFRISYALHEKGIGAALWYRDLLGALGANIEALQARRREVHWYKPLAS
jgi:hypothetical protein